MALSASFLTWLAAGPESVGRRCILLEAAVKSGGAEITRYVSTTGYTSEPADTPANQLYSGRISGGVQFTRRLALDGSGGSISFGGTEFDNEDGELDDWLNDIWAGRAVNYYMGDAGDATRGIAKWARSQFELIFSGTSDDILPKARNRLELSTRDIFGPLNSTLSTATIGGTGDNKDVLRPVLLGECFNITPVLLDPTVGGGKYAVHIADDIEGVLEVRDNGIPVAFTQDATLGTFTLTNARFGTITCDVQGATVAAAWRNDAGGLVEWVALGSVGDGNALTAGQIDATALTAFRAANAQPLGDYITDRGNKLAVMQALAGSVGATVTTTYDGKLILKRISLGFDAPLQTTLVPLWSDGSGTVTYTAASARYQTDFEGKLNAVLANEFRAQGARRVQNKINPSTPADPSTWLGTATVTSGVTDPLGGTTAYTITATGSKERYLDSVAGNFVSLAAGDTLRNSIYIRRRTGTGGILFYNGGEASAYTTITASVTTSWQRIAAAVGTAVTTGTNNNRIGIFLNTASDAVDVWRPMSENVVGQANQAPSEWTDWTADYGVSSGAAVKGVRNFSTLNGNTVASNVVTEATGAAINSSEAACAGGVTAGVVDAYGPVGEIDEPSQANVLGATAAIVRTMADAGWVASNITKGTATGADGVASAAASLTATAGNGSVLYTTVLGAAVRTYAPLVRRKTGAGVVNMTVDNGATWTPITLTTAYKPFPLTTASAANPIVGFQIVTSADAIEVDFNNLVAGAVAPAMPVPVNVTTAADVDQRVSAGNVPTNDFTLYGESAFPQIVPPAGDYYFWGSYVDANNSTAVLWDGTNLIARRRIGGANNDATIALTPVAGTAFNWTARFSSTTGTDIFIDDVIGTNDATNTACQIGAAFQIGADGNGAGQPYAATRHVRIRSTNAVSKITTLQMVDGTFGPIGRPDVQGTIKLNGQRNWTPNQSGLAGSLTPETSPYFKDEYVQHSATDATVVADWNQDDAPEPVDTLMVVGSDIDTECARRLALWKVAHELFGFEGFPETFAYEIGDIKTITHPRFGLSGGETCQIVGISDDWINVRRQIEVLV